MCVFFFLNINFIYKQAQEDAPTRIDGTIEGLTPGSHAIHVHTFGDFSQVSE